MMCVLSPSSDHGSSVFFQPEAPQMRRLVGVSYVRTFLMATNIALTYACIPREPNMAIKEQRSLCNSGYITS